MVDFAALVHPTLVHPALFNGGGSFLVDFAALVHPTLRNGGWGLLPLKGGGKPDRLGLTCCQGEIKPERRLTQAVWVMDNLGPRRPACSDPFDQGALIETGHTCTAWPNQGQEAQAPIGPVSYTHL
ncbi:MAG: hypothetical protein N2690_12425, partial [Rhodocyclaceae bacterium]|nr:hypothetical protein [Rhodocyclaceae bacterium]